MKKLLYVFRKWLIDVFAYRAMSLNSVDYDSYWKSKRKKENLGVCNSFQKKRAEWIYNRIVSNSTVLDLGCGDGAVLFEIMRHIKIERAIGVDTSHYVSTFLNSQNVETINLDVERIDFKKDIPSVDYIFILEVLEHMPSPERYLLSALDRAERSVFISFPNTGYLTHRLRMVFGRFPVQWRIHPGEHLRFWTLKDLVWWLNELGLESNSEIHIYEGVPILNKFFPGLFGAAFIVEIKAEKV